MNRKSNSTARDDAQVEIYKRRLGEVTVTYTATSMPARAKPCSDGGAPKKKLNASQITAIHQHRLLKSTRKVSGQRGETGYTSPTGLKGTIELVSVLIAGSAEARGEKASITELKQWTRRYLPEASPSLVEGVWSLQSTCVPTIHACSRS